MDNEIIGLLIFLFFLAFILSLLDSDNNQPANNEKVNKEAKELALEVEKINESKRQKEIEKKHEEIMRSLDQPCKRCKRTGCTLNSYGICDDCERSDCLDCLTGYCSYHDD